MDVPPLRPTSIQGLVPATPASQDKLAEGRIFQAQVLQAADGGSIVLGIGRERIAATSQAAFQVGQKLFLKVRGSGASRVFELAAEEALLAGPDAEVQPARLTTEHPFRWLARGQGLGELLADLTQVLGSRAQATGEPRGRALQSFAFEPGAGGAALAQQIARSGLGHEVRKLGRALDVLPAPVLAAAAEELLAAAFRGLERPGEAERARRELGALLAAKLADPAELARLLATSPPELARGGTAGRVLGAWTGPLPERLLDGRVPAAVRERIADVLRWARTSPALARAVLESLLAEHAPLAPARDPTAEAQGAGPDLKEWLAAALETAEPGRERQALRAALDALEAEQHVAVARASQDGGSSFVFALRDGTGFADARLVHRRASEAPGEGDGAGRAGDRAVLGLEFSRTGPVRADFLQSERTLSVRLCVSSAQVAAHLDGALGELRTRLEAAGRSVQLSVGVCPAEELRVPGPAADLALAGGRAAIDRLG